MKPPSPANQTPTPRPVSRAIRGQRTNDGDGVRLRRYIGGTELPLLDPFLLLDVFDSNEPNDYIAGFPPHPHRGFETVTYLLAGRIRHRDSAGHQGVVSAGGVQWMSAGRGIEHSEMPEQEQGSLHGFQLWINLPAQAKMGIPRYQEFEPAEIPSEIRDGARLKIIAGKTSLGTIGPVAGIFTQPLFWDIQLEPGARLLEPLPADRQAFIFIIDGDVRTLDIEHGPALSAGDLAVLGDGDHLDLSSSTGTRLLLIAARPLREPIARHGPFVMNTRDELFQAYEDYRSGRFGSSS